MPWRRTCDPNPRDRRDRFEEKKDGFDDLVEPDEEDTQESEEDKQEEEEKEPDLGGEGDRLDEFASVMMDMYATPPDLDAVLEPPPLPPPAEAPPPPPPPPASPSSSVLALAAKRAASSRSNIVRGAAGHVIEMEDGSMFRVYISNDNFSLECKHHKAERCVLTRKRTARPDRLPLVDGRPIGYMVAWLARGAACTSRQERNSE